MAETFEDTMVTIGKGMGLEISEERGTSVGYAPKEGFEEVSSETRTRFHWKLRGVASKLGADIIGTDAFDVNEQEVYDVTIALQGFGQGFGFSGFKTREEAIRNAVEFATRNGIDVDGYKAKLGD